MNLFLRVSVVFSVAVLKLEAGKQAFKRKVDIIGLDMKFVENGPLQVYTSIRKFNRTHTSITGNGTVTDAIDHRYRLKLEVQLWGDGGWKRNFVRYEHNNPCEQLKLTLGTPWKNVLKSVNASEKCPVQPGFYHAEDLYVDISSTPIIVNTGHYKTIIDIFKIKQWILTGIIEIVVTDYF